MNKPSSHYLGNKGKVYFADKFNEQQNFGRIYQSRYFAPYCSPDKVLLDYGCGDGTIIRQLPAAKKFAVEVNPHCHERIHELNKTLTCPIHVYDNIKSIESDTADVVISNHCLEHTQNPFHVLSEIRRVLVPGGILVIVTPFDDWRQKGQRAWSPGDKQNHLYTWCPLNFGNLLTEAGFIVQNVNLRTTAWSPKIFWVHRLFGDKAFSIACNLLSRLIQRREVLSVANNP